MVDHTPPDALIEFITKKHRTLIGEVHGTNEFPRALLRILHECSKRTLRKLALHLELPEGLTQHIRAYALHDIAPPAIDFDLNAEDGTFSSAIKQILIGLRPLLEQERLEIFCIDGLRGHNQEAVEEMLALNIFNILNDNKESLHIVYCGNIHASIERKGTHSYGFKTAGTLLSKMDPDVQSLYLATIGGSARNIQKDQDGEYRSRERSLTGTSLQAKKAGQFTLLSSEFCFDAEWNIGEVTSVN